MTDRQDPAVEAPDMTPGEARLLRGAKIAITVMGLLILAGFGYIGVEVYRRTTDPDYRARIDAERQPNPEERSEGREVVRAPGTTLLLPPGAAVLNTVAVGSRLAVTVQEEDGGQVLYFIDPARDELTEFLRTQPQQKRN